ncbi:MAG: App1 family protein [Elusimicrobiota bacterium]|jgi:hypothetical protein
MIIATLVLLGSTAFASGESCIKKDEAVLFFPETARPISDDKDSGWEISIHGWIFEPEKDSLKRKALLGILRKAIGIEKNEDGESLFDERARRFLVGNEGHKSLRIRLGGKEYALEPSKSNGHFESILRLDAAQMQAIRQTRKGSDERIRFRAVTGKDDKRVFSGEILPVDNSGISVLSDIDDTIKISQVADKKALLRNTFLRKYAAVPGMSEVFQRLKRHGAVFHYVSASPWQLYEPLAAFLHSNGFPAGIFYLKDFRLKDSSFFSLFASPLEYKRAVLQSLLRRFPKRRFILVGDSTEKDIDAYAEIAEAFPDRIEAVFIRDAAGTESAEERLRAAFHAVPREKWKLFTDPREILPWIDKIRE